MAGHLSNWARFNHSANNNFSGLRSFFGCQNITPTEILFHKFRSCDSKIKLVYFWQKSSHLHRQPLSSNVCTVINTSPGAKGAAGFAGSRCQDITGRHFRRLGLGFRFPCPLSRLLRPRVKARIRSILTKICTASGLLMLQTVPLCLMCKRLGAES